MVKTLELAIFDYDGVIADSFRVLHESYEEICRELGGAFEKNLSLFRRAYNSAENHNTFMESVGIPREKHAQADAIYKRETAKREMPFFRGIDEVLRGLSGCMSLVIVSSGHTSEIVGRLTEKNLLHLFQDVIGCKKEGEYLHKAEPIRKTAEKFSSSPECVVAIGDRSRDFFYAKEAGIPAENIILVDYGWGYKEQKVRKQGYCLKTRVQTPFDIITAVGEVELK